MVRVLAALSAKSAATAWVPAAAATVSVTAALDGRFSVAVTVATPPASEIAAGDRISDACGVASSSAMVTSTPAGSATRP